MPFKSVNFYMQKQFRYIMLLVIVLFLGGSAGYYFLEDWPFLDSLYMTIITLSTTGFKEVHPLSPGGQMLTMVLIIFGISRNKTGLIYNPRPDTKLMADDILIVIGEREDLTKLEEIAIV